MNAKQTLYVDTRPPITEISGYYGLQSRVSANPQLPNMSSSSQDFIKVLQLKHEKLLQEKQALETQLKEKMNSIKDNTLMELCDDIKTIDKLNLVKKSTLRAHTMDISAASWSPNSSKIVTVDTDHNLIVWDAYTKLKLNYELLGDKDYYVLACDMSPNDELVVTGGLTNHVSVFRMSSESLYRNIDVQNNTIRLQAKNSVVCRFKGHTDCVMGVKFVGNNRILSGSADRTCKLWDLQKCTKIVEYASHLSDVTCVVLRPGAEQQQFASTSALDSFARLFDLREEQPVQRFGPVGEEANCIEFFPNGYSFAVGTKDSLVSLYDIRCSNTKLEDYKLPVMTKTPRTLRQLSESDTVKSSSSSEIEGGVQSISFSSSGRVMFIVSEDLGCISYDLLKGRVIEPVDKFGTIAKVSPNGEALLVGSRNVAGIWCY